MNRSELAYEQACAAFVASRGTMRNPPGCRTGWPPGLLQDECRALARWFASRPDARAVVERFHGATLRK